MRPDAKLTGALICALAMMAMVAGQAAAKPATLDLTYQDGGGSVPLTTGQQVEGFDPQWQLETTEGTVECENSENNTGFLGKDETNNEKTDKISAEETFNDFYAQTRCTSTLPLLGSSADGFWFNSETGDGAIGQFKFTSKGKAEYVSAAKLDTVIEIRQYEGSGPRCYYEVGKLKGTMPTLPDELSVTFTKAKLKLVKFANSSALCPKKATVSTTVYMFAMFEEKEAPVEAALN